MNPWTHFKLRFRAQFQKRVLDARMDAEMLSHIDMQTQENLEAGMNPQEARRAALRQFGRIESIKETCRDQRGIRWLEVLFQDTRYGLRMLRKHPGFTTVAVLTLGLGIGANTAFFSVVHTVLLKPLPFPQPERVVSLWESNPQKGFPQAPVAWAQFRDWRQNVKSFSALAAWESTAINLGADAGGTPERCQGAMVTEDFFRVIGILPVRGGFAPENFEPGKTDVVIISHGIWRQRFGGDESIVGRPMVINGRTRSVVGIMPPGFRTPAKSDFWVPLVPAPGQAEDRNWKASLVLGRLTDRVTLSAANAELMTVHAALQQAHADFLKDWSVIMHPAMDDLTQPLKPALLVLLAAVALVLLMACANVANLLLARGAGRMAEFSVRSSLGAGHRRLLGQLLLESLVLAIAGGLVGILVAYGLLSGLLAMAPKSLPRIDQVHLDGSALIFTAAACLLTGILFGLAPALQVSRADPIQALHGGQSVATPLGWVRRALVILQMAVAVIVLCSAGLFLRSLDRLLNVALGFRPEQLMTVRLELPPAKYAADLRRDIFVDRLLEKLTAMPGIESAAAATDLPLQGWPVYTMLLEGQPVTNPNDAFSTGYTAVTPGYFRTLQTRLRHGRGFTEADHKNAPRVCVVNEAFAQRYFGTTEVLGRRIAITLSDPPDWIEIVGVAANTRNATLEGEAREQVFVPLRQQTEVLRSSSSPALSLAVRSGNDPASVAAAIRQTVWSLDKDQPLYRLQSMTVAIGEITAQRRFTTVVLAVFASVAVALAAIGLYGVMSHQVLSRTRELGIRMALGAQRWNITKLVLGSGGRAVGIGLGIGLAGAAAASLAIKSMLFEVQPLDLSTFAGVSLLLAGVGLMACWLPARRATQVDPMEALRQE